MAAGLRQIIKTILTSLPAAGNIAMLLFLQFFMYACLGMYIFGNTKLGANYDTRGNFRDFPSAMKLLLQVSDLPCNIRREGGQSLVVGGPSLVMLEGKACNPL